MSENISNFERVKSLDKENVMSTYGRFDVAFKKGSGSTWYDVEDKKYIDFSSGIGVNSVGAANDSWVKAVAFQAGEIAHTSNLFYNEVSASLAKKLCDLTGFSKVFFGNSGAEANEGAIKLARKYSFDKYGREAGRHDIICLNQSFHGRTVTTLAATGQDFFHNYFFPFTEGFIFTDANDIDMLKDVYLENSGNVCAVMIECIQGEGGVIPLDPAFVAAVRELCDENDLLMIVDEVQTGIGRTGELFCYQNYGVMPDVVTMAKGLGGGLPIGAFMCTDKFGGVLSPSTHATTYGGNPVVCAGANAVLDIVARADFLKEVNEKSDYFYAKLKAIKGVAGIRGQGLMIGIQLDETVSATSAEILKLCLEKGLVVLTAKSLIRLLPSLTISYQEIDEGLVILKEAIESF